MSRIRAQIRRWGSSIVIVIPSWIARDLRLEAGDEVLVEIEPAGVEEAFGSLRDWNVNPQKVKDEARESQ